MRQAYDYWQDQPGNYFPHRPTDGPTPVHGVPGDAFPDGSSSTTSVKTTFAHETSQDNPMVVTFGLSTYSSLSLKVGSLDPPFSPRTPISQVSGTLPLVAFTNEDHALQRRLPAIGTIPKAAPTTADLRVVNHLRSGHRQAIHIPSSSPTDASKRAPSDLLRLHS